MITAVAGNMRGKDVEGGQALKLSLNGFFCWHFWGQSTRLDRLIGWILTPTFQVFGHLLKMKARSMYVLDIYLDCKVYSLKMQTPVKTEMFALNFSCKTL